VRKSDIGARLLRALEVRAENSSDFDLNPGLGPPRGAVFRPAAVLVAVMADAGKVLLTKRSSALRHHPGQVAFPGGKLDRGDDGVVDAALREAEEEVGLERSLVDVLGTLSPHLTVTGFEVTPVLALIRGSFSPRPEAGEVEEAFFVPFAHLTDPTRFRIESRLWRGVKRRYYAVPWGPYYTWGATARMLRGLADRLQRCG